MTERTATLIGATGLIGSHLLRILQEDEYYSTIKVLIRRPAGFKNPKIRELVMDFSDETAFKPGIAGSDAVFCAVGTTQNKVKGDKSEYRKVDYAIPVQAAKFCEETSCPQFLLVSSIGASSKSNNFYLHLKGEVEDAVRKMDIRSVSIFRPSMLLGKREEFRPGEIIAKALSVPVSFLFPSHYKPVRAYKVAKAMVEASKKNEPGFNIYHYREIMAMDDSGKRI